ncbi:MAG TPA: FAD-binding oxidoreductase, partial [Thermomicrobiales bacterium]|nr:FAD-binding oxidoreductase [Thermomicrobiales bacterium]
IGKLKITHRWAGILGYTPDAMPLVGRLPDMPSVYFAAGFNGSGMSYGPLTARLTAEYMLDGTHPGLFHVDRLG